MNYKKHYDMLIERSNNRILEGYVEKHHIVPKCLGGTDEKSNISILTPEEHFLAHQLLIKMYPGNRDLIYATQLMTAHQTSARVNNKLFGWLRKQCALAMSTQTKNWISKNGHPRGMLGKKHDVNNIDAITAGIKKTALEKRIEVHTYNLDGSFYKTYNSLIECAKDLETNPSNVKYTADGNFGHCKNKQIRYDYVESMAAYTKPSPLRGKQKSEEHILNLKKAREQRYTCVHCGFISGKSTITRFHNNNCKTKL